MRSRDYRRFQEERVLIKRIKKFCKRWYNFRTENGDEIQHPKWVDFIGINEFNFYKCDKTSYSDSRYNVKYSPNKNSGYYRDRKPRSGSYGTRETDRILFENMVKEYYEEKYGSI